MARLLFFYLLFGSRKGRWVLIQNDNDQTGLSPLEPTPEMIVTHDSEHLELALDLVIAASKHQETTCSLSRLGQGPKNIETPAIYSSRSNGNYLRIVSRRFLPRARSP